MLEVNKAYQRKMDKQIYKQLIKDCRKIAEYAEQDLPEGTSIQSLMVAYKKVIQGNRE